MNCGTGGRNEKAERAGRAGRASRTGDCGKAGRIERAGIVDVYISVMGRLLFALPVSFLYRLYRVSGKRKKFY